MRAHYFVAASIFLLVVAVLRFVSRSVSFSHAFAPNTWIEVAPHDIASVSLLPLPAKTAKIATVAGTIVLGNKDDIVAYWQAMRGTHRRQEFLPPMKHWVRDKQLRVVFQLTSGERFAFLVTLHADFPVASYDYFHDPDAASYYDEVNVGDRASDVLYHLVLDDVAQNDAWGTPKAPTKIGKAKAEGSDPNSLQTNSPASVTNK